MTQGKIARFVLDLFFPPRCTWCDAVVGSSGNCACEAKVARLRLPPGEHDLRAAGQDSHFLEAAWACWQYEEPVKQAIWRLKFQAEKNLAQPLASCMAEKLKGCDLAGRYDLLVPVPISAKRRRQRGFNQSELLALHLSGALGIPHAFHALQKNRDTPRQMTLSLAERRDNVAGVFCVAEPVAGKRVLLVDDIITTGSTLNECASMLLGAGATGCGAIALAAVPSKGSVHKDTRMGEPPYI